MERQTKGLVNIFTALAIEEVGLQVIHQREERAALSIQGIISTAARLDMKYRY